MTAVGLQAMVQPATELGFGLATPTPAHYTYVPVFGARNAWVGASLIVLAYRGNAEGAATLLLGGFGVCWFDYYHTKAVSHLVGSIGWSLLALGWIQK